MRKSIRTTLIAVVALVAAALVLSAVAAALYKGTPAWYRAAAGDSPTPAQREQLARAAENKMIEAQNWAATVRADAQRARGASAGSRAAGGSAAGAAAAGRVATPRAEASHLIAFSDRELNALFDKWSSLHGWRDKYTVYLEDPRIILQDDRLILAGRMREIGAVASFQFRPRLDGDAKLHLDLVRVAGGKLPLPEGVWAKWRDQIVQSARRHLPRWRAQARIDSSGAANQPMMAATLSRLLFAVAAKQPAEPVLFLPLAGQKDSVPVKVSDLLVETGTLTLRVEPLSPAERTALLNRIRAPDGSDAQASGQ